MYRVYVAGAYSATDVLSVAKNINRGITESIRLMEKGFYVYSPWGDFQFATRVDLPMEYWKANGMAWLQVADAVFLVPGWPNSPGTLAEIEEAKRLNIPVFEEYIELLEWSRNKQSETAP